jgi:tetratricopeptide (TPR) repeat protein
MADTSLRAGVYGLAVSWSIVMATPASASMPEAEALIEQGTAFRKQGDDRGALAAFQRAWALDPSPHALAQLALAEQALGQWLQADRHLHEALQESGDPWIQLHRTTLEAAQREIVSQLGSVEISCNLAGAEVLVDGRSVGRTPLGARVRVVAGQSVIQVSAQGYFDAVRRVQVDPGSLSRVDVTLVADGNPATASGGGTRQVLMYGSLGLAALGVAVGVTGYWVREVNVRAYNDDAQCARQAGVPRSQECPHEASAWHTGEAMAIAGFSAGAVFGALGLYLGLNPAETADASYQACVVGPASLLCSGSF